MKIISHRIAVIKVNLTTCTARSIVHDLVDLGQEGLFFHVCEVLWDPVLVNLGVTLALEGFVEFVFECKGGLLDHHIY